MILFPCRESIWYEIRFNITLKIMPAALAAPESEPHLKSTYSNPNVPLLALWWACGCLQLITSYSQVINWQEEKYGLVRTFLVRYNFHVPEMSKIINSLFGIVHPVPAMYISLAKPSPMYSCLASLRISELTFTPLNYF